MIRPDAPASTVLNALGKFINETRFGEDDWLNLGIETDTADLVRDHPRLLRSLRFGDDDYLGHVIDVLPDVLGCGRVRTPLAQLPAGELPNLRTVEGLLRDFEPWLRQNKPGWHARLYGGSSSSAALEALEPAADPLSIPELDLHARRIRENIATDPQQALGSAKELLETVFKAILGLPGEDKTTKKELPELLHAVNTKFGISAQQLTPGVKGAPAPPGAEQRRALTRGLNSIVTAVGELRNAGFGTGHGGFRRSQLDAPTVQLTVTSAIAAATFYLQLYHLEERATSSPGGVLSR